MQPVFRLATLTLCLSLFFKLSVKSQTSDLKIGVINSTLFSNANGIAKLLTAQKTVDTEFQPRKAEIETLQKKERTLYNEIQASSSGNQESKREAYEKLQRDIRNKTERAQEDYLKRYNQLVDPIIAQVNTAIKQWSRDKGYHMVVDIAKDDKGFFWVEDEVVDTLTKDLINRVNKALY